MISQDSPTITSLRVEHHPTGLGIPFARPRISWRYTGNAKLKNWIQTSYEIAIRRSLSESSTVAPQRTPVHTQAIQQGAEGVGETDIFAKVQSSNQVLNPWPFAPLASRERVWICLRGFGSVADQPRTNIPGNKEVTSARESPTEWSEWLAVEAGLLERGEWEGAEFLSSSVNTAVIGTSGRKEYFQPFRLRRSFQFGGAGSDVRLSSTFSGGDCETLKEGVVKKGSGDFRARLYITALGLYEAYINGQRVGTQHMTPGWTAYQTRLQYQVYDVGALLHPDETNTIAVEVAEGWYAGRLVWGQGYTCLYGSEIGALVKLEVYESERAAKPGFTLSSDDTWEWKKSAILESGIYDGETYDAREEDQTWNKAQNAGTLGSSASSSWEAVKILPFPDIELLSTPCIGVEVIETVQPRVIFASASGKTLVDFGANLVGRVVLHRGFFDVLKPTAGDTLTLRHAEVLQDGELCTRPLRSAKATDKIIFSDQPLTEDWSPHFTFHGFRYVELTFQSNTEHLPALHTLLDSSRISVHVISSALPRTGYLETSNPKLNTLFANVVRSTQSNFLSIPTDCPQRDERLGWTGDIQAFAPTACFLYDAAGLLSNWLIDLSIDQAACPGTNPSNAGTIVPLVIPDALRAERGPDKAPDPQAVWSDVVALLSWTLWTWYQDTAPLRTCWDGMRRYVDRAIPRSPAGDGLWDPELAQLGDWLDPGAPPDNPGLARTDGTLVADAYLVHVVRTIAMIGAVLGEKSEAERYEAQAQQLVSAFRKKYMAPSGLIVGDSQTALALALVFGLHDAADDRGRANAAERLARLVRKYKFQVATGFAGTPIILPALSLYSPSSATSDPTSTSIMPRNLSLAYRMLLQEACPSWLYPVTMGATTIWERWDSMLPSGEVNLGEMTSFNHYALGSVAGWMVRVIGGVDVPGTEPIVNGDARWRSGGGCESGRENGRRMEERQGSPTFHIQPRPGGGLASAKCSFLGGTGEVSVQWWLSSNMSSDSGPTSLQALEEEGSEQGTDKDRKVFSMILSVPPNATAWVVLPQGSATQGRSSDAGGTLVGSGEWGF